MVKTLEQRAEKRRWYWRHREERIIKNKEWKQVHREEVNAYKRHYYAITGGRAQRKYYENHKEEILLRRKQHYLNSNGEELRVHKQYMERIKCEVLVYYSGGKPHCARCGIEDVDVLCFDHINNDGALQRGKRRMLGSILAISLRKRGYPEGYQVLCANCNLKKEIERRRNGNSLCR